MQVFRPWLRKGYDIRPTIAVTKAHIDLPEVREAVRVGRLIPDGKVLSKGGQSFITKVRQGVNIMYRWRSASYSGQLWEPPHIEAKDSSKNYILAFATP